MFSLVNVILGRNIKKILTHSFDIREGEYIRTLLLMSYIFLVISSNLILKPTVISLFLSEFGIEQLPIAFIFVAIFAAAIITFYSYSLTVTSIKLIIIRTFILSNLSFLLFWVLLRINFLSGWVLYLFYIWVAVFSVLSASQFWIFANLIFNSREAKRLFGIIGAGAIAGGIFGGYLTSILAEIIGSENLILVSVLFLSLCIPVVRYLWKDNLSHDISDSKQKKLTGFFNNHPINLIKSSKHLTYLALIVGVSVIVARLVEFQFSAVASREIIDEDELTSFFGFWFSNMNIISLLIQLFLTRRVVGVFGVGTSLFFLPAGIFIGTFAIFISPTIWAAILIRLSDGSLKQSINKSGMELLALPVPSEIKNQTKSYIDIFVDSIATGIGGFLLIVLSSGFDISIRYISFGTLVLLISWFYLIFKVKKEYINSFKSKLETNSSILNKNIEIDKDSVVGGIIKILNKGTDKQILNTLKAIKDIQHDILLPSLENLLFHPSMQIQLEALRNLYFYKSHSYNDKVKNLINDPDAELREEAFYYLFEHDPQDIIELMNTYINDPDKKISNSALISLAVEIRDNNTLKEKFNLYQIVSQKLSSLGSMSDPDEIDAEKITIARVVAIANLKDYYDEFRTLLNDKSPAVVNAAVLSIKNIPLEEFIPLLIDKLGSNSHSSASIEVLQSYGNSALKPLEKVILNNSERLMLKNIIEVLSGIGNNKSVNILFNILENDNFNLQLEILHAFSKLKSKYPFLIFEEKKIQKLIKSEINSILELISALYLQNQIQIEEESDTRSEMELVSARKNLINILMRKYDASYSKVFLLLGILYNPDDMNKIFKGLESTNEEMRMNAMEYLDNLLELQLKKIILPIVETKISKKFSLDILKKNNMKLPHEIDSYKNLLSIDEKHLISAVVRIIYISGISELFPLIDNLKKDENPDLKISIEKIQNELYKN